jgi:hypothetical protein
LFKTFKKTAMKLVFQLALLYNNGENQGRGNYCMTGHHFSYLFPGADPGFQVRRGALRGYQREDLQIQIQKENTGKENRMLNWVRAG